MQPIDLVAEQPEAAAAADLNDGVEHWARNDFSRGVVGKVDGDQSGVGPKRGAQQIHVEIPMVVDVERYARDLANVERHGLCGLVIRGDDDGMIARAQQHLHRDIDGLLRAREAQQVFRRDRVVCSRDLLAQRRRTVGFGVPQADSVECRPIFRVCQREQLRDRHVLAVRPGQVVFRGEFPFREEHLEREVHLIQRRRRSAALPLRVGNADAAPTQLLDQRQIQLTRDASVVGHRHPRLDRDLHRRIGQLQPPESRVPARRGRADSPAPDRGWQPKPRGRSDS